MSEGYDVDNRYILENKSFVDTKTNECLNFGLKDLSRVAVQLNCMERYLNNADEQIAKLQKQLKQSQKQFAIEQLKDLRDKICVIGYDEDYNTDYFEVMKEIDSQINELKGR